MIGSEADASALEEEERARYEGWGIWVASMAEPTKREGEQWQG
jgi:hypothetical protein